VTGPHCAACNGAEASLSAPRRDFTARYQALLLGNISAGITRIAAEPTLNYPRRANFAQPAFAMATIKLSNKIN
jgi:hypothetical protein